MTRQNLKTLLLVAALAAWTFPAAAQDRPDPQQLRKDARELMDKARDLKTNGNVDESEKIARKAKELARQAEELQSRRSDDRPALDEGRWDSRPEGDRPRAEQGRRERVERRERIETRNREERRRPLEPERGAPLDQGLLGHRGGADPIARLYHVRKAIKHLRAAGLYEQSDRLEQRMHDAMRRVREQREERLRDSANPRPREDRPLPGEPRERR